jgi:hypothetical protein
MIDPFAYPPAPWSRRHGPQGYADYQSYRPWLRNAAKSDRRVPDPMAVLLSPDVWVTGDGAIQAGNPEAAMRIDLLGLDRPKAREFRSLWIGIIKRAAAHEPALYQRLLGFPEDLPELSRLRPPKGNTRPEGIQQSCSVRKKLGTLPGCY